MTTKWTVVNLDDLSEVFERAEVLPYPDYVFIHPVGRQNHNHADSMFAKRDQENMIYLRRWTSTVGDGDVVHSEMFGQPFVVFNPPDEDAVAIGQRRNYALGQIMPYESKGHFVVDGLTGQKKIDTTNHMMNEVTEYLEKFTADKLFPERPLRPEPLRLGDNHTMMPQVHEVDGETPEDVDPFIFDRSINAYDPDNEPMRTRSRPNLDFDRVKAEIKDNYLRGLQRQKQRRQKRRAEKFIDRLDIEEEDVEPSDSNNPSPDVTPPVQVDGTPPVDMPSNSSNDTSGPDLDGQQSGTDNTGEGFLGPLTNLFS